MKTINELKQERMRIRITNPVRSSAIMMLIDNASKLAKKENREATEADITKVATTLVKEAYKDIEMYSNNTENTNIISNLKTEISIYSEFIPTLLSEIEIRKIVEVGNEQATFELSKANKGKCMAYFKLVPNMDMKILSKVLDEILV